MKVVKIGKGDIVAFIYTNWKGIIEERMAICFEFKYGTNEFYNHENQQFFMYAYDLDKKSERSFALANIKNLEVKGNVYDVMSYLQERISST